MTIPRRRRRSPPDPSIAAPMVIVVTSILLFTSIHILLPPKGTEETFGSIHGRLNISRRKDIENSHHSLSFPRSTDSSGNSIPLQLKALRESRKVVGERLVHIHTGKATVAKLLNGSALQREAPTPMKLSEIKDYLEEWLHTLHKTLQRSKQTSAEGIWQAYHDLTLNTLYVWDQDYLSRMPRRRSDNSIFLSVATFRDENCINTLNWAYEKARDPSNLFVGLVQQNCLQNCLSAETDEGEFEQVGPDEDCYEAFCDGHMNAYCNNVRILEVDEAESLGPYAARYMASKLWYGEQWFMQIDAHMTFAQDWDANSVKMLIDAPSEKPVISHYPPDFDVDLEGMKNQPGSRLCGPIFATSEMESQIIRLEGGDDYDKVHLDTPRFAPFTAAGYFVAHSDFLREVPFDPFLPWIFMGEEIILSTRLWTSGYDFFSPTHSVVGHMYGRESKPKFWESVHRTFHKGVYESLQLMVLDRIKHQLGYPEAARDFLQNKCLLSAVGHYTMGTMRPLSVYFDLVGLNTISKEVIFTRWCEFGNVPPGFEAWSHLYQESDQESSPKKDY